MWKSIRLASLVLATALGLVACGDATSTSATDDPAATATEADAHAATEPATRKSMPRPAQTRVQDTHANRPPIIRSLTLRPADDDPSLWQAVVEANDAEGDDIELEYVWYVNRQRTDSHGERFDPSAYERGDRFHVEVTPSDRSGRGAMAGTTPVEISNAAPDITSAPPSRMAGGVYRYMVKANDPEGDQPLRYELLQSPNGMHIDPYSGELEWRPAADQAGTHTVEIAVSDNRGGRSTQLFELPIASPGA